MRSLSKFRARRTKKRTSVLAKAKYKPRTTRANRTLIESNALAIRAVKRMLPPPIRCDFQLSGVLYSDTQPSPSFSTNYEVVPLMDPANWRACLRQDDAVPDSSTTRVLRMQMNLRYHLFSSNWAQFTMFVVTVRKDSADREITSNSLQIQNDYINSVGSDMNVRVSPQLFKVHATRNVSLTKNTFEQRPVVSGTTPAAFNPATTWKTGQVNIKMGINIRNPNRVQPWKDMEIEQFSPNQRYYLLCFFTQQADVAPGTQAAGARLEYDALFTTYNAS